MVCYQFGKEFKPQIKTQWFEAEPEDGYIQCPHCGYEHSLENNKLLKFFKTIFLLIALLIADIPLFFFDGQIKWLLVLALVVCSLPVYKFLCKKVYFLFAKK